MGKYATTRVFQRDRSQYKRDSSSNTFSSITPYLTDVPKDKSQFMAQTFLYNSDPTGIYRGYLGTRDTMNYWEDYFKNTGLTWSDVRYPTMMMNYGSITYASTYRSALNFVSRNFARLYR